MHRNDDPIDGLFVRRFSRFRVEAPVIIDRGAVRPSQGMAYSASSGGCCLVASDALHWTLGEALRLTFPGDQRVDGTIRWIHRTFLALEFAAPVERLVLDAASGPVVITRS